MEPLGRRVPRPIPMGHEVVHHVDHRDAGRLGSGPALGPLRQLSAYLIEQP